MGALIGFIIGYALGTKAGPERVEELKRAFADISKSPEFRGLLDTGRTLVQSAVKEGGQALAEQLRALAQGRGELGEAWQRLSANDQLAQAWAQISSSEELRLVSSGSALLGSVLQQVQRAREPRPPVDYAA